MFASQKRNPVKSDYSRMSEIDRCDREIESAKDLLRAGHPDVAGLMLAVHDWQQERRLLEVIKCDPYPPRRIA